MKSIKEKSEEIFPIEERDSLETELKRRKMRQCYEHGANYVLEQIEKFVKFNRWSAQDLYNLIEKLKGNQ